jgi:signal transduction histidine kinase
MGRGTGTERPGEALTFPDLPRLELDQLLGQLVERASEVIVAQGRLRGLLHANQLIVGHLSLPDVLRGIVDAARELTGARYAALGIIAPSGGLSEFVHSGMPAETVDRIGHLPQGKGLLGALIEDPRPIRLGRIADDPRSSGFPDEHPPMGSFLGVPIRIRAEVFGNLYLTESTKGAFTSEDEELTRALAATAAVAIENARLYEAARTRGEWLQASAAIMRQLLSPEAITAEPLQVIAERSRDIAGADLATVLLPPADGDGLDVDGLHVDVAVGPEATQLLGVDVPVAGSLAGLTFTTGEPLRLPHPLEPAPECAQELAQEPPHESGLGLATFDAFEIGAEMTLPLRGPTRVLGVLTLTRNVGRQGFTAEDLDMAGGFANQAALAIELAAARAEQQRGEMLDERERIAADLHDHVIQRLFAAGLALQAAASGIVPGRSRDRVEATVEDLDTTIRQLRTSIFHLQQQPTAAGPQGIRARLLAVATEASTALGFDAAIRFSGVIDTLPEDVGDDLEAVLREALSNVARHAQAHCVDVDVTTGTGQLRLDVRDDGVGIGPTTRRSGLVNLGRRAARHGGTCTVEPAQPSGTRLSLCVPLP